MIGRNDDRKSSIKGEKRERGKKGKEGREIWCMKEEEIKKGNKKF